MLKNLLYRYSSRLLGALALMLLTHACIDERVATDPNLRLAFSKDTLLFDTVFTTVGSSTMRIKVFNPNNKNLRIAHIGLGMGEQSAYRINVDGAQSPNNRFANVDIRAKDSLFIFVEVKIDPLASNAPILVQDSIEFITNSNLQDVKLIAYGQNMEILRDRIIQNDTTLNDTKPYLVIGDLVVDSAKTLTLNAGCKLYFHDKASLAVYGNLIAEGTREKPILLRGDRTDRLFEEVPYNYVSNQWGGVLLFNKTGKHTLNHVNMNSGYVGVYFSNSDRNYRPKLEINNCRIHNFLKYGLVAQNGDVAVTNSEISNTGAYSVYLNGGKHSFVHCTIANYFNNTNVLMQPSGKEGNAAVMIMELNRIIPMESSFVNCVIAGTNSSELDILSRFGNDYHGVFANSYIRKPKPNDIPLTFENIAWYNAKDTLFVNSYFDIKKKEYYNFSPDSVSPARDIAKLEEAKRCPIDLNGNNRLLDGKPDAGAYEWQPKKHTK